MSMRLNCEAGHSWDAEGTAAQLCPVCGGAGRVEQRETVLLSSTEAPTPQPEETLWKDLAPQVVVFDSDPEIRLPTKVADENSRLEGLTAATVANRPTLPGYEILEELGRGGMGVVYKAMHIRLKRLVALKMILAGQHAGAEDRDRFVTEAEAAARLQHANIVQIYEIGEHDGRHYFSLEYVDGGSLDDHIEGKPQPPRAAARLVEVLARAMYYAHVRGIIHRDLKPANILLSTDHTHEREPAASTTRASSAHPWVNHSPKITDFGLAKKLDADEGQTRTGSILGTPNYMAPEQATGQIRSIGPCSDIYALGAILYELLTGRPPFVGESAYDTLRRVATAEPLPPRSLIAGLPRDIETICLKCLHKDSRRRYSDAQELARDLRRFQDGESIHARPNPPWERAAKWTRRRPAAAAMLAASVIGVVAMVAFGAAWNARLQAEAKREAERSEELQNTLFTSERRLVRLIIANGTRRMDDGDLIDSLPWFAEAMRLERDDEHRVAMHRLRFAAVLDQCPSLAQVWFHASSVNFVAFSPDGRLLVSAGDDGAAFIWDVATGMARPRTPRHDKSVRHAAFSTDGSIIATASADGTARLWHSDSGLSLGEPMKHPDEVVSVAFSPDGNRLLTACRDGVARLWDVTSQQPVSVEVRHLRPLTVALFSPEGTRLLTAADDGSVQLWNAQTGVALARPPRQRGSITSIAFSPDGRRFLTGSADGVARAWHADSGLAASPPLRHAGGVMHVEFSGDGRLIATAGADQTARVWNAANGQAIGNPLRHGSKIFAAVFGPAARRLLTVSDDDTARVWDVTSGEPMVPPLRHNGSVVCGAYSPDGRWIATGGRDGMVRLWSATTSRQHVPLLRHQGRLTCVVFSPSGRLVATAGEDRSVRVWNSESGSLISEQLRHPAVINRIAFSPDERFLLSADQDGAARLWNVQSGAPVGQAFMHGAGLRDAAFRPDGTRIVTAGEDGTARIWDVAGNTSPVPPLKHSGPVFMAAFSPDGQQILTASGDGTACQWDAESRTIIHRFQHPGGVNFAAYSRDGRRIATSGADHTARVWDAVTGEAITPPLRHGSAVSYVAFSQDGEFIVTSSDDNTARVWKVDGGHAQTPPLVHMGSVSRATFNAEGDLVATASDDGTARLWDALTGEPITPALKHGGPVIDVAFTPHGNHFVTAGPAAARLWRLAPDPRSLEELLEAAKVLAVGRIDETGGLVALQMDEVRDAWRGMHAKENVPLELSDAEMLAWHRREFEECEMCGDWHAAVWHLDHLLAARPNDARLLRLRGDARAGMGDWHRALTDYSQAVDRAPHEWEPRFQRGRAHAQLRQFQLAAADFARNRDIGPDDSRVWYDYALVSLAAGDVAGYRSACADLHKRFGGATDVETARLAVWTATLAPRAVTDLGRLVTEAERCLHARPKSALYRLTLAAALLRAGKSASAIEKLEATMPDAADLTTHALLLLTLAYQQSGRIDEARQIMDRAIESFDEFAREREEPTAWARRLELELLRSEAELFFKREKP
jgi:WD40 repeat protein/serine/threonine protein kinase/tetratricopeptide (TPR) repeat protein